MAELSALEDDLRSYDDLAGRLEDARVLHTLAQEESDRATWEEALRGLDEVDRSLDELETLCGRVR